MTKKSKHKKQLEQQLGLQNRRGETFVGFRSTVFASKKYNKKESRRKDKVNVYEWN